MGKAAPLMIAPQVPGARIEAHWVYGTGLAGVLLLVLAPLFVAGWPLAEVLVFLILPAYMLHQWEEHDGDRFRRFVNRNLAGGAEALTLRDVFWINVPGVWGLIALALWLMRGVAPGWGVIAAWLIVVNAVVHWGPALATRRRNPGMWTAGVVFLPLGGAALWFLGPEAGALHHSVALALVIATHAAIFGRVRSAAKATRA